MFETIYFEAKAKKSKDPIDQVIKKFGIVWPNESIALFHATFAKFGEANKNSVMLAESVEEDIPTLLFTNANFGHRRAWNVCGTIVAAWKNQETNEIEIVFSFLKSLYPKQYEQALELFDKNELDVSFELKVAKKDIEIVEGNVKKLNHVTFDGVGLLMGETPAYPNAHVLNIAKQIVEDILGNKNESEETQLVYAKAMAEDCRQILQNIQKAIETKGGNIMDKKANDALLAVQKNNVIAEFGEEATKAWTDEDFCNEEKINALRESLKTPKIKEETSSEENKEVKVEENFAEEDKDLEEGAKWTRKYINTLPNSSFAVIEPAYLDGKTDDKNCRHLPFKDENGKVDLPHLRNAFARVNQIKPVTDSISQEELQKKALAKLEKYRKMLETANEQLSEVQAEIEKEEVIAQPTVIVTETKQVVTDIVNPEANQETIKVETKVVRKVDEQVKEERKENVEVTYTYAQVEEIKAEYVKQLQVKDEELKQKDILIASKDAEIKFVKENAKKITELRAELGDYVKDLSDEELINNTDKIEIARLRKENTELKAVKKEETTIVIAKEDKKEILTAKDENANVNEEDSEELVAQMIKEEHKKKSKKETK